jgi:hypothetical protein
MCGWYAGGLLLTYRVKYLPGEDEFSDYLHRIGMETTTKCHHCDEKVDSAQYTLEHCPAWAVSRHALTAEIEVNLLASTVLRALLTNESDRRVVAFFCGQMMFRKEAVERKGSEVAVQRGSIGEDGTETVGMP